MKELSTEEKAKRYDEALEKARQLCDYPTTQPFISDLQDLFPELKESEDERMWKLIKKYAHSNISDMALNSDHITREQLESWLEKQGEQKIAWSEEDENLFRCAIDAVKQESKVRTDGCLDEEVGGMVIDWFKSLKERVQPKQEWSKEDERYLNNTISYLKDATEFKETAKLCIDWLKSLRPQSRWKPSDEQMEALDDFIYAKYPNIEKYGAAVKSLY